MTDSGLLTELYEQRAFKPAPSLWELAHAHVPFDELGMGPAPEPQLCNAIESGDGLSLLIGKSGSGKSSVISFVASTLEVHESSRKYLPIFVPVAARQEIASDLTAFGRAAILEVLLSLRDGLPREYRDRLLEGAAREITTQRSGARFNAKLVGRLLGSGADAGVELAGDVTSIVRQPGLDNRGGVRTLGDIIRARDFEPVLLVEDTDAWASIDGGEGVARGFFTSVLRPLATEVDIAPVVAAQTTWESFAEFQALRERAESVSSVPVPASHQAAGDVIRAVLNRRIQRGVDSPEALPADPSREVFTDEAIDTLATELHGSGSFRMPLAHVRDALDRFAGALPERLDRGHLVEVL